MKTEPHRLAFQRLVARIKSTTVGNPIRTIYDKGGDDLLEWLVEQTPEGSTIMETLAAIASDAMYEEKE